MCYEVSDMDDIVLKITNLVKTYKLYSTPKDRVKEAFSLTGKRYSKDFNALNNISLDVKKGETVGIIGTNGAGKSTLLKIITGVLTPTAGTVEVKGKIAALLELGAGFNQEYTGIQNIYLNGRMMGYTKKQMDARVQNIVDFADIGDFINQPVKTYSSGMFARLAFAVSINVEPDILIIDEALSVGDLFFQNKCFRKFEELKSKGVTILFVSHDIASVRQMCSRVLWIDRGNQKIFDKCDLVCDLYMDEKRKNMNSGVMVEERATDQMNSEMIYGKHRIPKIQYKSSDIMCDKIEFISCYIKNVNNEIVNELQIEHVYEVHIAIEFFVDMKNLILGFVFENNKGLPIYDINNYINQHQTWYGKQGTITEVIFKFKMPRLMKGTYVVSTALAQGTQENHVMLTWLHGVMEVQILNEGYNSSYIEIPSEIRLEQYNKYDVDVV